MPPALRKGISSKSRQTYGRQRSFLEQDETVALVEDNLRDPQEDRLAIYSHPGLAQKRRGENLESPSTLKRTGSFTGSESLKASLSRANSRQSLKIGGNTVQEGNSALKASHELREAGQSHRFKDNIEYIMEGIRTKDRVKIRRASCLELARSMLEEDFLRHVKAYHYMPIIFETIHNDKDPIVFSCLVLMIGILLLDGHVSRDIVTIEGLVHFLCQSLEMDMDPMAMLPTARQEATMYNDFKDIAKQSGIIQKGQKVLTKSLTLSVMTCIVQESVTLQDERILSLFDQDAHVLNAIIEILIQDLAWIRSPLSTPNVSLSDVLDIDRIENGLRILERFALVSRKPASILANNTRLFPLLVQLITLCRAHAFQYPHQTDSMNLMLHALRLLINVTNGFTPCCENLSRSGSIPGLIQSFIQFYGHCRNYNPGQHESASHQQEAMHERQVPTDLQMHPQRIQWTATESSSDSGLPIHAMAKDIDHSTTVRATTLNADGTATAGDLAQESEISNVKITITNDANGWYDILLLSIGLLINMLEASPQQREQITSTECKAMGDCFHKECQCVKTTKALERIVEIYNIEVTVSEMTENQVLAAYLALLLGCIVRGDAKSEVRLYRSVAKGSLAPMIELLTDFVEFQQAIHTEAEQQGSQDKRLLSRTSAQSQYPQQEPTQCSLSSDASLTHANSFMSLTLESEVVEQETITDNAADSVESSHTGISFTASRTAETLQSVLGIIEVLQSIEIRLSQP
ncbi:hypothetical protein BG011_003966 [Mortierella polycephala]|uniref:Wings apart-like protein C-terminal domain-containing protein n=1 Tax=Mortierella polycephala TaxID=41804 RepID=A0A9P6PZU1_9FUNG|nr:hypothetical protein BG011_003966 [Mortierella polycephala]